MSESIKVGFPVKNHKEFTYPQGRLRSVTEADLKDLLQWRNHPRVREVMITQHQISWEEHLAWWDKTRDDPAQRWYIYFEKDKPEGVVSFFRLNADEKSGWQGAYLCDYSDTKSSRGLTVWKNLEHVSIQHAFEELNLRLLLTETRKTNKAVLYMHRKHGFRESDIPPSKMNCDLIVMELENKKERGVSAVFLGSANWDLATQDFLKQSEEYLGRKASVLPMPFGQYQLSLQNQNSEIYREKTEYWIFCERFEDFFNAHMIFDEAGISSAQEKFNNYLALIEQTRHFASGYFLVLDLWPVNPAVKTIDDAPWTDKGQYALASKWNKQLCKVVESLQDAYLVDFSSLVQMHGSDRVAPDKYWHLGRIAYSAECSIALNRRLLGQIMAITGSTSRLLIVDADNTLWGGLVGEDGPGGIQIGGDNPGSQFTMFQSTLVALKRCGFVLALCSKNDEGNVLNVFKERKEDMLLRKEDFSSFRINWNSKAENIREIASELNLGLKSVCFIDDNSYERENVRYVLPDVTVPEMPQDVCEWPSFLLELPCMFIGKLTEEDKIRTQQYEILTQIREHQSHRATLDDFLASLKMEICFESYAENNRQRVVSLLVKTNQFNTTTRRYKEEDISRIMEAGGEVFAVRLKDRLGSNEIIGVIILLYEDNTVIVDELLLSCRVLGRSIETAMLAWTTEKVGKHGIRHVRGLLTLAERNFPVRQMFTEHGFHKVEEGIFSLDLSFSKIESPTWITMGESQS